MVQLPKITGMTKLNKRLTKDDWQNLIKKIDTVLFDADGMYCKVPIISLLVYSPRPQLKQKYINITPCVFSLRSYVLWIRASNYERQKTFCLPSNAHENATIACIAPRVIFGTFMW